jgi:dTDP-4-amino-4,6-dideoxygalactose transaminase
MELNGLNLFLRLVLYMNNKVILCANPLTENKKHLKDIRKAITKVITSGSYILGPEVEKFENNLSQYLGNKYCVGVNSGTDALIFSLKALDIKTNDEVIVPSHTATATISAIVSVGATPIFVDIEDKNLNIDPIEIEKKITTRTKAIIMVHIYGHPCEITKIMEIADRNKIHVIEDCAQSLGATYKSKQTGSFGILSCFSFYPTKNLGGIGDAGAVSTDNKELFEKIKMFRQYGWNEERVSILESNQSRLDEIQAAILNVKMKYLDETLLERNEIAEIYSKNLNSLEIEVPNISPNNQHSFHLYVIRIKNRQEVIEKLNSANIYPGIHYKIPVHLNPVFAKYSHDALPVTERIASEILSLPLYPGLKNREILKVVEEIKNASKF